MQAVLHDRYGPPEDVVSLVPDQPRAFIDKRSDAVLVKVLAASLTQRDLRAARGDFSSAASAGGLPSVLGADVSGVVEAVGELCRKFRVGDEVIGIVQGSMAEYVAAPEAAWVRKPRKVSHLHAAAFPLCGVLAFQCLYLHGKLKQGEKILILNGSGGVGSLAVQMAKYKGAKVYATASKHVAMVESLGAEHVLDYGKCLWWEQLRGANIDVILDFGVGYSAWAHSGAVLNPVGGRFVSLVPDKAQGKVGYLQYNVGLPWRSWRNPQYVFVDAVDLSNNRHLEYIAKMVQQGFLKPVLDPDSPFEFSPKGVRCMVQKLASNHTRGKLIMNVACPTHSPS